MKIFAATITHKHGTDLYVSETEDRLNSEIFDYVDNWWQEEIPEKAMPKKPEDAIRVYFEHVEDEYLDRFGAVEVTK